jgi:hypothetical protein
VACNNWLHSLYKLSASEHRQKEKTNFKIAENKGYKSTQTEIAK